MLGVIFQNTVTFSVINVFKQDTYIIDVQYNDILQNDNKHNIYVMQSVTFYSYTMCYFPSVIMLNDILLNDILLRVILYNAVKLSVTVLYSHICLPV